MTIKSYPLWPFEPNWDTPLVESLQWLTDVIASDDGSEQRRSLRFYPRRGFEFALMAEGSERSFLDNLLTTFSSATWYLPLWHDVTILGAEATAGQNEIAVVDGDNSGLSAGKIAVVMDDSVFEYELVEIASVGETITTVDPLTYTWGAGSRIMPVTEARLLEQPTQSKLNDRLTTADVQFEVVEKQIPEDYSATAAGPLIQDGLLANAYNLLRTQAGLLDDAAGQSQGQFIFIHALFLAYEQLVEGSDEDKVIAEFFRSLAQDMLDAIDSKGDYTGPVIRQPLPDDVDTITLPHHLFAAKGDASKHELAYAYEVEADAGTLTIPSDDGGSDVFRVWSIYPASSDLLYENPFSPAFDSTAPAGETQIELSDDDWEVIDGDTVITIPLGAPAETNWKVVYGYTAGAFTPAKEGFDATPEWEQMGSGKVVCSPDTLRWFEMAMQKAVQFDNRSGSVAKWSNLRDAVRRSGVKAHNVGDERNVFEPLVGFPAIPTAGEPTGMFCYSDHPDAVGPSVTSGDPDWTGYDFWSRDSNGDIVGTIPSITVSKNAWATVKFLEDPGFLTALLIGTETYLFNGSGGGSNGNVHYVEVGNSRTESVNNLISKINEKSGLVDATSSGSNTILLTAKVEGIGGTQIGLRYTPGLSGGFFSWITGGDGNIKLSSTSLVLPAEYNYTTVIGRKVSEQWRMAETYQDPDQYLYVAMSASVVPDRDEGERIRVFVSEEEELSLTGTWYADIDEYDGYYTEENDTIEFWIPRTDLKSMQWWGTGPELPEGTEIKSMGVSIDLRSGASVRIRQMRLVSGATQTWVDNNQALALRGAPIPFAPGAAPHRAPADVKNQYLTGANGMPTHGQQLPDHWWWAETEAEDVLGNLSASELPTAGLDGVIAYPISPTTSEGVTKTANALLMEQQLMFLSTAQAKYAADGGVNGFFAHTFVQNTGSREALGDPTPHSWVYYNDDPETDWSGYQARVVESLARVCLLTNGDARFKDAFDLALGMANDWLDAIATSWPDLSGTDVDGVTIYGMPNVFPDPSISAPQVTGEDPHNAALVLRACLLLRSAGLGSSTTLDDLMSRCWTYLEMLWRDDDPMAFTWSPNPDSNEWYGVWHGEILTTLASILNYPTYVPSDIDLDVVRERMIQSAEWLKDHGVGGTKPDESAGITDIYHNFAVFPYEPNEDDDFDHTLERNIDTFDPETGITAWRDISGRAFHKQDFVLQLDGRLEHQKFANLAQKMRGMAMPVWVPTFNQDFVVNADVEAGSPIMSVDLSGFVIAGGPRDDRKHLMIETTSGRIFREIVDADQVGGSETLYLDEAFPTDIPMGSIVRVCFMTLMRLTSDTVEIEHHTDNSGLSDVKIIFRSAPDTRIPESAFYR